MLSLAYATLITLPSTSSLPYLLCVHNYEPNAGLNTTLQQQHMSHKFGSRCCQCYGFEFVGKKNSARLILEFVWCHKRCNKQTTMATSLLRRWHALRRLHWHTAVVPSTTLSSSSSPSLPHQTVTAAFPSVRAGGRLGGAMCTVNHRLSCRQCSTTAAGSEPSPITADDAAVSSVKGPRQIDLADRRAWDHIAGTNNPTV